MSTASSLLDSTDVPAVEILNPTGASRFVLVCDHASNRIPIKMHDLGLTQAQLAAHISWDLGAADVARMLSLLMDAPLVLSGYSRLVIDCNRPLNSKQLIAEISDGVMIPGNRDLTPDDRDRRLETFFYPYHEAIAKLLNDRQGPTALLSIHSFTANLSGNPRPWHIGVACRHDERLAKQLYAALLQHSDIIKESSNVGYNQPYAIEDEFDYTLPVHGEGRGLPCAMIEIRQNEIQYLTAAAVWAARIAQVLQKLDI